MDEKILVYSQSLYRVGSGTQLSNPGSPVIIFQSPYLRAACTEVSNTWDTEEPLRLY